MRAHEPLIIPGPARQSFKNHYLILFVSILFSIRVFTFTYFSDILDQ